MKYNNVLLLALLFGQPIIATQVEVITGHKRASQVKTQQSAETKAKSDVGEFSAAPAPTTVAKPRIFAPTPSSSAIRQLTTIQEHQNVTTPSNAASVASPRSKDNGNGHSANQTAAPSFVRSKSEAVQNLTPEQEEDQKKLSPDEQRILENETYDKALKEAEFNDAHKKFMKFTDNVWKERHSLQAQLETELKKLNAKASKDKMNELLIKSLRKNAKAEYTNLFYKKIITDKEVFRRNRLKALRDFILQKFGNTSENIRILNSIEAHEPDDLEEVSSKECCTIM